MTKFVLTIILPLTFVFINCGQTQSTKQNQKTNKTERPTAEYAYEKLTIKTGKGPGSVEIADFNKDGKGDIVVSNFDDNTINILLSK